MPPRYRGQHEWIVGPAQKAQSRPVHGAEEELEKQRCGGVLRQGGFFVVRERLSWIGCALAHRRCNHRTLRRSEKIPAAGAPPASWTMQMRLIRSSHRRRRRWPILRQLERPLRSRCLVCRRYPVAGDGYFKNITLRWEARVIPWPGASPGKQLLPLGGLEV